jgi:hypothetical protein
VVIKLIKHIFTEVVECYYFNIFYLLLIKTINMSFFYIANSEENSQHLSNIDVDLDKLDLINSNIQVTQPRLIYGFDGNTNQKVSVNQLGQLNVNTGLTSLEVSNFPDNQLINGTVGVSNFPANQTVSGTDSVDNHPTSIQVSNLPATQQVSGSVSVDNQITGFATQATLNTMKEYQETNNTYNVLNSVRYHRSQGNCFIFTAYGMENAVEHHNVLFHNPSTSLKNIYVYNMEISFNRNYTETQTNYDNFQFDIYRSSSTTSSRNGRINLVSLNLDNDAYTSSGIKYESNLAGYINDGIIKRIRTTLSGTTINEDYYNEYLKIPPGWSLWFEFNSSSSLDRAQISVKYIETTNNI